MISPQLISLIKQQLPDLNQLVSQKISNTPQLPQPAQMQDGGSLGMLQSLTLIPELLNNIKNTKQQNFAIDSSPYKLKNGGKTKKYKYGGSVSGYREYDAKSHAQGGQKINEQGVPDKEGTKEVELKENAYTYRNLPEKTGETYVFSDKNKTASLVDKIIDKYKFTANLYPEQRNKMELEIKAVEKKNEAMRPQEPAPQQMYDGGSLVPGIGDMLNVQEAANRASNGPVDPLSSSPIYDGPQVPEINRQILTNPAKRPTLGARLTHLINNSSNAEKMRAVGLAGNFAQLFNRPEQESLISPNFNQADSQMNRLTANLNSLRDDAVRANVGQSNVNRSASSSFQQFSNREAQGNANLLSNLQRIALQEQSVLNNISQTKANYEQFKATDFANRSYQNRVDNLQNQAQNRNIKRVVMSDIVAEADRLSQIDSNRSFAEATTKEGLALLNLMYPNVQISEEEVRKLQQLSRGEISESDLSPEFLIKFNK